MLKITIVVGNPKPRSRTRQVAERVAAELLAGTPAQVDTIDLIDHADAIYAWPSEPMAALTQGVAESGLVILASPTYKASYTGLLKSFLDRYPAGGLKDVVAIPVMTGADQTHSLAPTVHLVPLLLELGATVPVGGFYFNTAAFDQIDAIVGKWASDARESLRIASGFAGQILFEGRRQ